MIKNSIIVSDNRLPVIKAEKLSVENDLHLKRTAEIIKSGGIVAFPFNGIYGLFGDINNHKSAKAIIKAKKRPKDKNLIVVSHPEYLDTHVDFSKLKYSKNMLSSLWSKLHALGIILPASEKVPKHLIKRAGSKKTVLIIWTEYAPLRRMLNYFRELGGEALVGTSANKSGTSTHINPDELWNEFASDVDAVIVDHFDDLPLHRKKSTSIIDLTGDEPYFRRSGNVSYEEIQQALIEGGFPQLKFEKEIIQVIGRLEGIPIVK